MMEAYLAGKTELKDLLGVTAAQHAQLRARAQFFIDGGHWERAVIMLEMLEELDRNDALATLLAIEALLELGRSDAAEAKIARLLARDPNDLDARVAKAELHLAIGEVALAARLLERVLAESPDHARARYVAHRGHTLLNG